MAKVAMKATDQKSTHNEVTLDPNNSFERVLINMVETHRKKKEDYAGDFHPNQNFYDSGSQVGQTAGLAVEQLIGTKQARLKVLLPKYWLTLNRDRLSVRSFKPQNESIVDTLLDRAVYSVIAVTIWDEGGYQTGTAPVVSDKHQQEQS